MAFAILAVKVATNLESEGRDMKYRCYACGHVFEDGEQARWSESRGEFWGASCTEEMSGCPVCRSEDYEEITKCAICGEEHSEDELNGGVCDECINARRKDFTMCYRVSMMQSEKIYINSLLASLFEPCDIEQILKEYIKARCPDIDCSAFIDIDKSWFGEHLAEEVNRR
jgi:hypothetical protein